MRESKLNKDKSPDELSDSELMESLKSGDRRALSVLMNRYHNKALNIAYRYLGDFDESEDAAQDSFVKVYNNRDKYDSNQPFAPWFFAILVNNCRDRIRRKKTYSEFVDKYKEEIETESCNPGIESKQIREAFNTAMAKMPEAKREILALRFVKELSYKEIAKILDISEGTVMSRLFRAKSELAEKLKSMGMTK